MPKPDQTQATPADKRKGWLLVGGAVAILLAQFAAVPLIRHSQSHFVVGLLRGLGMLPVFLGVAGVRAIRGPQPAKAAKKGISLDGV